MFFILFPPLWKANVGSQMKKSPTGDTIFSNMLRIFNIDLGGRGQNASYGDPIVLQKVVVPQFGTFEDETE